MEKKGEVEKSILLVIILILITLIAATLVSAGWLDWIKKSITGKAASEATNVSIAITGVNNITIWVWNNTYNGFTPTADNVVQIQFNVTIMDPDGYLDINDSSIWINITHPSKTYGRQNTTACKEITNEYNATAQNYTCSTEIAYFDKIGAWTINVTGSDLGGKRQVSNDSMNISINQLQSISLSHKALTWPSVTPGATNQTSNNDPTVINNTGNYNTSGKINISAINLYGETTTTEFLNAANFTIDTDTGGAACSGAACTECDGRYLKNDSFPGTDEVNIPNIVLEAGNYSVAGDKATDDLYYCLWIVPSSISSQTYSTNYTGATGARWTWKIK